MSSDSYKLFYFPKSLLRWMPRETWHCGHAIKVVCLLWFLSSPWQFCDNKTVSSGSTPSSVPRALGQGPNQGPSEAQHTDSDQLFFHNIRIHRSQRVNKCNLANICSYLPSTVHSKLHSLIRNPTVYIFFIIRCILTGNSSADCADFQFKDGVKSNDHVMS